MAVVSINHKGKVVKPKAAADDKNVAGTPGEDEKKTAAQTQSSEDDK